MIVDLLDRDVVERAIHQLRLQLADEQKKLHTGNREARERADESGVTSSDLDNARAHVDAWSKPEADEDAAWIARDPVASAIQYAYDRYFYDYKLFDADLVQRAAGKEVPTSDVALQEDVLDDLLGNKKFAGGRFSQTDARWISWWAAAGISRFFRGKRAFTTGQPPLLTIADKACVIIVGDWGSGLPRAQQVATAMRMALNAAKAEDRQCHVIHLGDVYYCGMQWEYDKRFLPYWPVRESESDQIASWSLNANHDMYSGGSGYFDYLLGHKLFKTQKRFSYFGLENTHWQLFGLDSAYDDGDLYGDQARWVWEQRTRAKQKAGVLFSHHQLFSPYEGGSPKMQARLERVLSEGLIRAWFWGHEHRCALYKPTQNIQYPRLVGHGGVPVWASTKPSPPGVIYEYQEYFFGGVGEKFARFGFAILDFDADKIAVRYVNERGEEHYREVLTSK
jgi:hypothetical protein